MNAFLIPLKIQLGLSASLQVILLLVYLLAGVVVLSYSPTKMLSIALLLALIWSAYHTAFQHILHKKKAIRTIILKPDKQWLLETVEGTFQPAELLPDYFVQPWLTVLRFKLANGDKRSAILLKDNVDQDAYRRLRVRLLHDQAMELK